MTHLRQKMLDELQRRNYSQNTVCTYMHAVEDFSRYFHRSPDPTPGFGGRGAAVDSPPAEAPETGQQARPKATGKSEAEDVDGLKKRLAELEKVVSSLAPRRPRGRRLHGKSD